MSDNFDLKKYLIENKVTANSRMLKEDVGTEKQYTVIESYTSRREDGLFDYEYVTGTDPKSALIKYFVVRKKYTNEDAEAYLAELETQFDKWEFEGAEIWPAGNEDYIVTPGSLEFDKIAQLSALV